jgi:3-hydroxybutyryl-CoA dehydratase
MKVIKHIQITEKMVEQFGYLVNDYNPIHFKEEYAQTTIFKKRIAHGMLISSFISGILANHYPGEGSIYLNQELKFLKPCYLGDELTYIIELTKKINSKYYLLTNVYNEDNDLILEGSAIILKNN